MALNGKSKGSAYERATARELSQWLYGNEKSLFRSRASGALFTRGSFTSEVGDISPIRTSIYFPFCVECKSREKGCDLASLYTKGEKSDLYKWFVRNEEDAKTAGLFSLLIFKQNYIPQTVLFRGLPGSFPASYRGLPVVAFRFSQGNVLYSSKFTDLVNLVPGSHLLELLKNQGYKAYGE